MRCSMKDFLKCAGLLIVGLFVAVIGYPFLHESGHSLVAFLVGASVTEFNLLPLPYVVCEVSEVSDMENALIGLGGIVFPFIVSMSSKPKRFWLWYANLLIKGISTYAILLSAIATMFYINGINWQNEDIVQVLNIFPGGRWIFLVALCIMAIFGLMRLLKEKIISRCIVYFDKTTKSIV